VSALPPPTTATLLDQLRASFGADDVFHWRQRLLQERLMKNVTALQEHVLLYVRELLDQGIAQFTHDEVAEALKVGISTVRDALRRAKGVGLVDWREDWRPGPNGSRRRTANVYEITQPQRSPEPRPDLRRRSSLKSKKTQTNNLVPSCSVQCDERAWQPWQLAWRPTPGFEARFATKLAEEKRRAAARFARGSP